MGSVLQLLAGILWAYIIGGLVGVVTAMEIKNELFRERIDAANHVISVFMDNGSDNKGRGGGGLSSSLNRNEIVQEKVRVAKRIRRYVYSQSALPNSTNQHTSSLSDAFPVLESLTPELQLSASLMLAQTYLERIPYLSMKYLSREQQANLARQCVLTEFPKEEHVDLDTGIEGHGRGILVQYTGSSWRASKLVTLMPIVSCAVVGAEHVLLKDGQPGTRVRVTFTSFSQCMFIPRTAIMEALAENPNAWTECARWKYLAALFVESAVLEKEARGEP